MSDQDTAPAPSVAGVTALEGEVNESYVQVQVAGHDLRILPAKDWPVRAIRALNEGDYDYWAELCLAEVDYQVWFEANPTVAEVEAMFEEFNKASGVDPGKQRARSRSLNSTRAR